MASYDSSTYFTDRTVLWKVDDCTCKSRAHFFLRTAGKWELKPVPKYIGGVLVDFKCATPTLPPE